MTASFSAHCWMTASRLRSGTNCFRRSAVHASSVTALARDGVDATSTQQCHSRSICACTCFESRRSESFRLLPPDGVYVAQVERIRSLAHCAADLSKKHDVVSCHPAVYIAGLCRLACETLVPLQEAAKFLAQKMADELTAMPIAEAMPICRACGHYLNLTSIAETHHRCHSHLILDQTCALQQSC